MKKKKDLALDAADCFSSVDASADRRRLWGFDDFHSFDDSLWAKHGSHRLVGAATREENMRRPQTDKEDENLFNRFICYIDPSG